MDLQRSAGSVVSKLDWEIRTMIDSNIWSSIYQHCSLSLGLAEQIVFWSSSFGTEGVAYQLYREYDLSDSTLSTGGLFAPWAVSEPKEQIDAL